MINKKSNNPIKHYSYVHKINIILFFLLFISFCIIAKLFYLQIIKHGDTAKYVSSIANKVMVEKPYRGSILDRNGNDLAISIRKYKIYLDAKMIKDLEQVKEVLGKYNIQLTKKHYERIQKRKSYIPIVDEINESTALEIMALRIEGIGFEPHYIRYYPEKHLAAHVIGLINSNGNGAAGIENYFDKHLSGKEVKYKQYTKGSKKILSDKLVDHNGHNITLTIDKKIQFILEQELSKLVKIKKAKRAIGIVEDPHTGAILASCCIPEYDPNEKVKNMSMLVNNVIGLNIEPGSTFKIVVLSACLEQGIFKSTDKINCEHGKFKVADGSYITDHEPESIISVARAIEVSSNIATAKMAIALGKENFYKYIRLFGFNSKTAIDLNGENIGILKDLSKWSARSLPTISFGQEISTTPLQIINAFCVIANGGLLLKPQIVQAIGTEYVLHQQVIRRVISEETASNVRKILKGVVSNGTGKSAKIKGYSIAGKTGTAQKIDPITKKYSKQHYYASFCGMIPADNPQIVIFLSVDEPEGSYYAASVVAPVFAKIATKVVEYLKIPADEIETHKVKNRR